MSRSPFPPFVPHPLLRGGHAQTLAGVYWPSRHAPHAAREHRVRLDDGDQIMLHDDLPPGWWAGQGVCLLIHGLAGCRLSGYMRRIAAKLSERGLRVLRMDLRGCGAGEGLARLSTHCGRWADAAAAIRYAGALAPGSPIALVGFSLGGTIALNLAIEAGSAYRTACGDLRGVLAVCPPIDLHAVRQRFDSPLGRPYDRHFVRLLWQKTRRRAGGGERAGSAANGSTTNGDGANRNIANGDAVNVDPAAVDDSWRDASQLAALVASSRRPRRLREYDEWITAPLAGYRSAEEYYTQTSPGARLGQICVPTTIIAAEDDPIVPAEPLKRLSLSDTIDVSLTRHGGHLGYVARLGVDPDRRWLDWRVVEWVTSTVGAGSAAPAAAGR